MGQLLRKNSLATAQSARNEVTIQHSNFTPGYRPKGNERMYFHKNVDMNVHSSIMHSC